MAIRRSNKRSTARSKPRPVRSKIDVAPGVAPNWTSLSEVDQAVVTQILAGEDWRIYEDTRFRCLCWRCKQYIEAGKTPVFWRFNKTTGASERMHVDPCGLAYAKILQTTSGATTTAPLPGNATTLKELAKAKTAKLAKKASVTLPSTKKEKTDAATAKPSRAKFAAFDPKRFKF